MSNNQDLRLLLNEAFSVGEGQVGKFNPHTANIALNDIARRIQEVVLDGIDHEALARVVVDGQNIHTPSEAYDEELLRDTAIAINNYLVTLKGIIEQ